MPISPNMMMPKKILSHIVERLNRAFHHVLLLLSNISWQDFNPWKTMFYVDIMTYCKKCLTILDTTDINSERCPSVDVSSNRLVY